MAINYSDVNYITNGQAITADNLNAPSVDLASRSVEVQRNALYEDFLENYSNSVNVQLIPRISSSEDASYVEINSMLFDDGNNNYSKSYSFELTDAVLSVYSNKFPGARYIVEELRISQHFSDNTLGGVMGHFRNSVELHVPGDGLYLKRPTKYVSSVTDFGTHAEAVMPNTEGNSAGRAYIDASQNLTGSVVKLPLRNKVTFSNTGYTVETFITAVNSGTWGGSTISGLTATVDGSNVLSIEDDNGDAYNLYITGLQNVKAEVYKVYLEGGDLVLEVSPSTAPIYHQIASTACTNIGLTLYSDDNMSTLANSGTLIINQGSAEYSVGLVDLDSSFMYIPLARLTETSLIIGNREFSLVRNYISNNSSYSSSPELVDLHGAPIEYFDTSLSNFASKSYKADLRSELPIPKGKITLGKRSSIVEGALQCDFSRDPKLLRLLEFNRLATLNLLEIRVTVLTEVTTNSPASGFRVSNQLITKNSSNTTVNYLYFGQLVMGFPVNNVDIPSDSLSSKFNEVSITSTLGVLSGTLTNSLKTRNTDCVVEIYEDSGAENNAITDGEVYVELDLLV